VRVYHQTEPINQIDYFKPTNSNKSLNKRKKQRAKAARRASNSSS